MQSNTARDLAVRGPRNDEELRLANELILREQRKHGHADHWEADWGKGYPGYALDLTRIAYWRGELAGALRIHSETMRLGEARLKLGGLGWITATERHRDKGVSRGLLEDALLYLSHQGYHLAMMFGRPHLYYPFGFATAFADYAVVVETLEALKVQLNLRVRHAKPGDLRVLQKIHNDNDNVVPCSVIRNSGHFANRAKEYTTFHVLTDDEGRVQAYFFAIDCGGYLGVDEVGVRDLDVCPDVLRACGDIAAEAGLGTIRFLVPPPHVFGRYLLEFPSRHEMDVVQAGGGMLAAVDVGETLENLVPEWESLLAHSILRDVRIEATLVIDGETFRIRGNKGAVDVAASNGLNKVSLSRRDFVQLLTGYRYVDDILALRRGIVTNQAREFLTVLFPKRTPYVWTFDRF